MLGIGQHTVRSMNRWSAHCEVNEQKVVHNCSTFGLACNLVICMSAIIFEHPLNMVILWSVCACLRIAC